MSDPYADIGQEDPYAGIGQHIGNSTAAADTQKWQQQIKGDLVGNNSFAQNALIGSGKFFTDMGLGARQMYATVADKVSPTIGSLVGNSRTDILNNEAAEKKQIDAPVMGTAGGKVGQIATGVLTAIPAAYIPGANTYIGAATLGAAYGALAPTTQNDSRLLNAGVGAGLGIAGKYGSDKLAGWLSSRAAPTSSLTPAQQSAAQAGEAWGMELTPGQQTGNKALQQFEAKLQSQPYTSGPFNKLSQGNQQVLNSTVASALGESGNSVDSSVLSAANDRLGNVFESVRNQNSIIATNPQATAQILDGIDQSIQGLIPGVTSIRSNPLVSNLEGLTSQGSINGEQLGQLSSKLGRAAFKQMSSPIGDRDMGQALYAVKEHVDDLLQSSLSPDMQATYGAARQQYRALMNVTSRVGIVNPSTGNVSGASLANKLQQADKSGFLYGNNQTPMYQAARFAQAFKPIVGDSGTATRLPTNLQDIPLAMGGDLFSRAYLSTPGQATVRAALSPGNTLKSAISPVMPSIKTGLPGLTGTLVPYLTQ